MKQVTPDVNFPNLEHEVLTYWDKQQTFQRSNSQRQASNSYTFYDGPPFANGLPHYGHLLANTIKDTVPRYWNMRGYQIERRFGWDCHGVPVEYEIEKRDNLRGRADILAMGVAKFNEECRKSVQHYVGEWQKTITRLGRWVDWSNQYRTMDKDFMESVWWVFSELYAKGLVYKDFKVVPYSPRITAVLSNFEANQNYKDTQDPAITVKCKASDEDAYFLAWTTTPWTLISNLALCVGPEIDYVKVKDLETQEVYYLAASRLSGVYKTKKGQKPEDLYEVLETLKGSDLAGRTYQPLFPYFANHANAFRVLVDDYVTTDDGTGIVHQAPAYGEDDYRVCHAHGITLVDPLDDEAKFKDAVPEFKGQFVKDADKDIIRRLKDEGKLLRHEQIVHSYPFCERTDSPLIYRAITSWYVAVERFRDKLVANNQTINWVPGHLRDGRMGKWLENARDWAISRNRFWGTPLPIWICDKNDEHIEVFGAVKDLETRSNSKLDDLHIHFVDKLQWSCSCGGTMKRVAEVFDCWFESGSMPYAQNHYPFENKEKFEGRFPADFIAEGLDQTRGWFYTLSVLSTALFDRPAFKNVVVNGIVLAEDGRKMSKRLRNYTPPEDLLNKFGADSVRLFMLNSAVLKAGDLVFSDKGVKDTTRAVLLPLWNAYSFLSTYAVADGWQPTADMAVGLPPQVTGELDRWIISRFQTLLERVQTHMEKYHLYAVVPEVLGFIEDLTNWYIRLSRKRFWGTDDEDTSAPSSKGPDLQASGATQMQASSSQDTEDAYQTLYYVLCGFTKVFAPFAPFISERIYQNMTDGMHDKSAHIPDSVHLCDMPLANRELIDADLEKRMSLVRRATNLGRSLRAKHQLKTRQVLASMLVITRDEDDKRAIAEGNEIIRGELNIKEILFSTEEAKFVRLSVKPNLKTLGRRLGKDLQTMRKHFEVLSQSHDEVATMLANLERDGQVEVLGHTLTEQDFLIDRGPKDDRLIATEAGVTVLLETKLTEELIDEGLAREVINRIQRLRKDSGLQVSDRISLTLKASDRLAKALDVHRDYIARETLATNLKIDVSEEILSTEKSVNVTIDQWHCGIAIDVAT